MKEEESSNHRAASPQFPGKLKVLSTPTHLIHLDSILNSERSQYPREPDSPAFPGSEVYFREHPPTFEQKMHKPKQKRGIRIQNKRGLVLAQKQHLQPLIEDNPFLEKKGIQEIRKVYGKDAKLPVTPIEPGQQVVYVNALQYSAFCKYRIKKQKKKMRLLQKYGPTYKPASTKTYMHESRHKHAKNRVRDSNGRFLRKEDMREALPEVQNTSDALLKMLSRQESETDHLDILNRMPDID